MTTIVLSHREGKNTQRQVPKRSLSSIVRKKLDTTEDVAVARGQCVAVQVPGVAVGEAEERLEVPDDIVVERFEPGEPIFVSCPQYPETGAQATWVSRLLASWGMDPWVINAHEVRAKALRPNQKSDFRDAREICEGVRRGLYQSRVYIPDPAIERLRLLISRRRHFVGIGTRQINAAKHLLRSRGIGGLAKFLKTERAWKSLIAEPEVADLKDLIALHAEQWKLAQANKATLEKQIDEAGRPYAETSKLLQTMMGVGPLVALTFIAALGDPKRFAESGRVVSYAGLAVSTYDSGGRERHGHITKRGNSELRAMLCEAAQHAWRPTHPLNPYFRRAMGRCGRKQAIIAVAQRLVRILWRMWLTGEPFKLDKLNVRTTAKSKTVAVHYEIKDKPKQEAAAMS